MNQDELLKKLEEVIVPHVSSMNLELVDVEYVQDGAYMFLRVYVENLEKEISLDECADLSHLIEEDVDAVIEDKFFLEVSSPGLERPLKKEKDYERFVGEKIKIITKNKLREKRNNTGILTNVENGNIHIEIDGEISVLSLDEIKKANLVFEFDDF